MFKKENTVLKDYNQTNPKFFLITIYFALYHNNMFLTNLFRLGLEPVGKNGFEHKELAIFELKLK